MSESKEQEIQEVDGSAGASATRLVLAPGQPPPPPIFSGDMDVLIFYPEPIMRANAVLYCPRNADLFTDQYRSFLLSFVVPVLKAYENKCLYTAIAFRICLGLELLFREEYMRDSDSTGAAIGGRTGSGAKDLLADKEDIVNKARAMLGLVCSITDGSREPDFRTMAEMASFDTTADSTTGRKEWCTKLYFSGKEFILSNTVTSALPDNSSATRKE